MGEAILLAAGGDPIENIGGHVGYVRAHARALIRIGFEPHLFCVSRHADTVETQFGIVHRIRSPWQLRQARAALGFRLHLMWLHAPLIERDMRRFILRRPGSHLIHGFGVWGCAGVRICRKLSRIGRQVIPIVSAYTTLQHEFRAKLRGVGRVHGALQTFHAWSDLAAITWMVTPYERIAYTRSHFTIVNYDSVRRLLQEIWGGGIPFRKLPYSSESAFLHEHFRDDGRVPDVIGSLRPPNAPLIVAVSRHDPRKGLDVLLHALAELRAAEVPFRACLVSGGLLLDAHRRLAARLDLESTTAIVGVVPDPLLYLRHADVFALPSLQEASGSLALIEALQAGVAVVTSNIDGIPEDVVDGESALLVRPGDPGTLATALKSLLTDPGLRERLAEGGRATFESRFSADVFTSALRQTYAELGVTP